MQGIFLYSITWLYDKGEKKIKLSWWEYTGVQFAWNRNTYALGSVYSRVAYDDVLAGIRSTQSKQGYISWRADRQK